ncbi:YifB family Mg chelatase-like AAA ATPase [Granulosicoccus sp. 3-233]|uniref:YifB family Mg chelatase-like AAA ATPase n=1 Tax=Granulosicoccus sp. 3-233 TaxID=3417969 RepID=UPI003D347F18
MSYATVHSCTLAGVRALPVTVEVHISGGLPGMSIVGLPQSAVRESKDRVKAAIQHMGLKFPQVKIIVNLAPADLPKRGGRFDLPIALGILQADGQLPEGALQGLVVLGELGLTGELRSVTGILPTAYAFADSARSLFIPTVNVDEALRCSRTRVFAADSLQQAYSQLKQRRQEPLVLQRLHEAREPDGALALDARTAGADMCDVIGQHKARRALEIAAAGGHNLLMAGPPGTGKSMLASRLPGIQPPMSESEAMETASIASISYTGFDAGLWGVRPFRAPHHTASGVALVGGGSNPMPGEVSLAHHGVLFLDELTEFSRSVLDVLREPLETGHITVSRAARQAEFPARFQLVGAMNPCPCGYHTDTSVRCQCTPDLIMRYQSRLSGPFLDRIDLHVDMQRELNQAVSIQHDKGGEGSDTIRQRVVLARERQLARQAVINSALTPLALHRHACLDRQARALICEASKRLNLSLRSQHRLLRVARTIADLDGHSSVGCEHLGESLSFRRTPLL